MNWPEEQIPDSDNLYMRLWREHIKRNGQIARVVFQDHGGAMSTDWDRYSTPEESQRIGPKPSQEYGVIGLNVEGVRSFPPEMTVEHSPTVANRAHTNVVGEKTPEARVKLRRLSTWQIKPS